MYAVRILARGAGLWGEGVSSSGLNIWVVGQNCGSFLGSPL